MSAIRASLVLGAHIASVHVPDHGAYKNDNVGLYLRGESWQAGAYRNSIDRTSAYAALSYRAMSLDWMAGAATGYQRRCERVDVTTVKQVTTPDGGVHTVTITDHLTQCSGFSRSKVAPFAAVSYAAPNVFGATPRITLIPGFGKTSAVIHLSAEWEL